MHFQDTAAQESQHLMFCPVEMLSSCGDRCCAGKAPESRHSWCPFSSQSLGCSWFARELNITHWAIEPLANHSPVSFFQECLEKELLGLGPWSASYHKLTHSFSEVKGTHFKIPRIRLNKTHFETPFLIYQGAETRMCRAGKLHLFQSIFG